MPYIQLSLLKNSSGWRRGSALGSTNLEVEGSKPSPDTFFVYLTFSLIKFYVKCFIYN